MDTYMRAVNHYNYAPDESLRGINEYTYAEWHEFLAYLRKHYGKAGK